LSEIITQNDLLRGAVPPRVSLLESHLACCMGPEMCLGGVPGSQELTLMHTAFKIWLQHGATLGEPPPRALSVFGTRTIFARTGQGLGLSQNVST